MLTNYWILHPPSQLSFQSLHWFPYFILILDIFVLMSTFLTRALKYFYSYFSYLTIVIFAYWGVVGFYLFVWLVFCMRFFIVLAQTLEWMCSQDLCSSFPYSFCLCILFNREANYNSRCNDLWRVLVLTCSRRHLCMPINIQRQWYYCTHWWICSL